VLDSVDFGTARCPTLRKLEQFEGQAESAILVKISTCVGSDSA